MLDQDKPLLLSCPVINADNLAQMGAALSAEDVTFLKSLGKMKKFAKDSVFVYSGETIDQLVYLEAGLVRMVAVGEDGSEKTYSYFTPGCFIGEAAFFHRQPVLFDLRFLERSTIYLVDGQHLAQILQRPSIVRYLLVSIALVSRTLAMQIGDAAFRTTEEKVCRTLFCLSGEEYTRYKPFFTHQEIADLAGVHRVTVTNTLAELKKEGIVSIPLRGHIHVLNREKLRHYFRI